MVHINLEKSNWPYALGTPKGAYGNKTALAVTLGHVRYIPRKPKEQMFSFVPGPTRPISQPIRHTRRHSPVSLPPTQPPTQSPCIYSCTAGLPLQYSAAVVRTYSTQLASTTHGKVFRRCSFQGKATLVENRRVRYPAAEALPAMLTARVPVKSLCPTMLLTQVRLSSRTTPAEAGESRRITNNPAKLQRTLELYISKHGELIRGYQEQKPGNIRGKLSTPPARRAGR